MLGRLVVQEDRTVPFLGTEDSVRATLGANMLMFVCSKQERTVGAKW